MDSYRTSYPQRPWPCWIFFWPVRERWSTVIPVWLPERRIPFKSCHLAPSTPPWSEHSDTDKTALEISTHCLVTGEIRWPTKYAKTQVRCPMYTSIPVQTPPLISNPEPDLPGGRSIPGQSVFPIAPCPTVLICMGTASSSRHVSQTRNCTPLYQPFHATSIYRTARFYMFCLPHTSVPQRSAGKPLTTISPHHRPPAWKPLTYWFVHFGAILYHGQYQGTIAMSLKLGRAVQ